MSITGDFLDTFDILRESDIKGCVHYIFVGLFYKRMEEHLKSEREHL